MLIKKRFDKSEKVVLDCSKTPSRTKQCFRDECDANNILKKYRSTGVVTHIRKNASGKYGDFSQAVDYQGAMNAVISAQEAFGSLPAQIRERFGNDPGELLAFLNDPKNVDEAVKMGLVEGTVSDALKANTSVKTGVGEGVMTPSQPGAEPAAGASAPQKKVVT